MSIPVESLHGTYDIIQREVENADKNQLSGEE